MIYRLSPSLFLALAIVAGIVTVALDLFYWRP